MSAIDDLKKEVDELSMFIAKLAEKADLDPKDVYLRTKTDMIVAMLNLAATDGYFDSSEAFVIAETLNLGLSREQMMALIKENNFPSVEVLKTVPVSLKFLCVIDKMGRANGDEYGLAKKLIDVYNKLFVLTVVSDGKKDDNEIMSHAIMLNTMINYVKENS